MISVSSQGNRILSLEHIGLVLSISLISLPMNRAHILKYGTADPINSGEVRKGFFNFAN